MQFLHSIALRHVKLNFNISLVSRLVFQTKNNQGFKNQKSWYMFFSVPNNMFTHTIMHLTFPAPQIVICPCLSTKVYLVVHLPQKQKFLRVEVRIEGLFHTPPTQNLVWVSRLYLAYTRHVMCLRHVFYLQFEITVSQIYFLNSVNEVIFFNNL